LGGVAACFGVGGVEGGVLFCLVGGGAVGGFGPILFFPDFFPVLCPRFIAHHVANPLSLFDTENRTIFLLSGVVCEGLFFPPFERLAFPDLLTSPALFHF